MNRFFLVSGIIAALVGIVVIVEPGVLARIGFTLPSALVVIIGVLALLEAARVCYGRFARSIDEPSVPEPERRTVASVLGTDFDARLAVVARRTRSGGVRERNRIRDRLTDTAVEILVRYDGNTPEHARERLQKGLWTDDRTAAAFFASVDEFRLSPTERFRMAVSRDDAFCQQARRAVSVLADRSESRENSKRTVQGRSERRSRTDQGEVRGR